MSLIKLERDLFEPWVRLGHRLHKVDEIQKAIRHLFAVGGSQRKPVEREQRAMAIGDCLV